MSDLIETAYNIIRISFGNKILTNKEYAHLIKRDFGLECSESDIDRIQSPNIEENVEDLKLQWKHIVSDLTWWED